MKKRLIIVPALLLLGACGKETVYIQASPTQVPQTTQYVPEYTPNLSTEDTFIALVEELSGPLYGVEGMAIETGYGVCEFIRNGGSFEELEPAYDESFDQELIASVIVASINVFCPDQRAKMETYMNGY